MYSLLTMRLCLYTIHVFLYLCPPLALLSRRLYKGHINPISVRKMLLLGPKLSGGFYKQGVLECSVVYNKQGLE